MQSKHQKSFHTLQNQQDFMQKQVKNPNKTLAWSSINSNSGTYQQIISPLNYKVSNPSSSLIMSSLSNIYEDSQNFNENTQSTDCQNIKMIKKDKVHKKNVSENNNFYQFLIQGTGNEAENQFLSNSTKLRENQMKIEAFEEMKNGWEMGNKNPININTEDQYVIPDNKSNYTLMHYNQHFSAQESLMHLQQSQEELTFLKYKLQEAYQKLEKQILNSYGLEEKIQLLKNQLDAKGEIIQMQKTENQKLKFTLKAIIKNKSLIEEQMQKDESKNREKSQTDRQNQLKENLKLKLQIKDLQQTIKQNLDKIDQLNLLNKTITQQLTQSKKQAERLKNQTLKKDKYLENLSQQLQLLEDIRTENKRLLLKQTHYLSKINVLEVQLRKITDEKVTVVGRLKHEIALVQKQNDQLIEENDSLAHQTFLNVHSAYSPASVGKRTPNNTTRNISISKNTKQNNKTPLIFDSEGEQSHNTNHQNQISKQYVNRFSLRNDESTTIKRKNLQTNKQNLHSQNINQQEISQSKCSELSKTQKSVGKWKRNQSISNNSSVYFQSGSNDAQNINEQIQAKQIQTNMPQKDCSTQKFIESKLTSIVPVQSQDQKLSKYQQHRKNIENELMNLEKIKRPSKEEREKIQKLEKQLYYLDSDIAGLKRKIRRKY